MQGIMIGLDTAKSVFQLHIVGQAGAKAQLLRLSRRKLLDFFARQAPSVVGMEACGAAHYWARELVKLGHEARLIPPIYVKSFVVGRMKSDARDANGCYLALGREDIHFVPIKSEEQQAERALHRAQELLVRQRTQLSNHLRGLCSEFGLVCKQGYAALMEQLQAIETGQIEVPALFADLVRSLGAHLRDLNTKERDLSARMVRQARASKQMSRLMKVPSVGPVIAHALVSGVVEPAAFSSARHFAAWLGLTPSLKASGNRRRVGAITKQGDETLRRLLVQGAMSCVKAARKCPHKADPWLFDLLKRRPPKVAAVALAARTARILWAMMRREEDYCPAKRRQRPTQPTVMAA
jgi:transposase